MYLAEEAGLDTAERFLTNAEASFNDLARQPMIDAPLTLRHPDLTGLRKWRIKDFKRVALVALSSAWQNSTLRRANNSVLRRKSVCSVKSLSVIRPRF